LLLTSFSPVPQKSRALRKTEIFTEYSNPVRVSCLVEDMRKIRYMRKEVLKSAVMYRKNDNPYVKQQEDMKNEVTERLKNCPCYKKESRPIWYEIQSP
jgi:hypothetical protein